KKLASHYRGVEAFWSKTPLDSDSKEEESSLKAQSILSASVSGLILEYTAGTEIHDLNPLLENVITKYETFQKALSAYEGVQNISPLAIGDWLDQYEECVQIMSICILLDRNDLLARFVTLIDNAGYAGKDALYEDLLAKVLPHRTDVDTWYHLIYSKLLYAIYAETPQESSDLIDQYCKEWYPAFAQAPWHDTHLVEEEGGYFGYWSFEAGAIAYLYGIDDSQINHMVYPKDLVQYARETGRRDHPEETLKVYAGGNCTRSGFWYTPAKSNSKRFFSLGEFMPEFKDSSWGATIWYWSGEKE
ncbi:PoNe immunity protein domain-containing protein, partial [Pseudomonas sp.]|uniref:PoNe immunity protein domain-containing protein n=1 Tax=Pseudomonas sp. TaxID=306 RepID=UPI003CC5ED83